MNKNVYCSVRAALWQPEKNHLQKQTKRRKKRKAYNEKHHKSIPLLWLNNIHTRGNNNEIGSVCGGEKRGKTTKQ